jgi:hypothetical protein
MSGLHRIQSYLQHLACLQSLARMFAVFSYTVPYIATTMLGLEYREIPKVLNDLDYCILCYYNI